MPPRPSARSKAIERALERYATPTGPSQRQVGKLLKQLQARRAALAEVFGERASSREADALRVNEAVALCEESRDSAKAWLEAARKLGDPQGVDLAELGLKEAEGWVGIARAQGQLANSTAAVVNHEDRVLFDWLDGLIDGAVNALFDDRSAEVVMATVSGGLIIAGVTGPVGLALAAAAASALVLATDVKKKLGRAEAARVEGLAEERMASAITLIALMNEISDRWLTILR